MASIPLHPAEEKPQMDEDVLVGLRFEVSGGLGRMAGRVIGKTGALYLVQKDGAEYLELLELDDLRSAKFYRDQTAESIAPAEAIDPEPSEPVNAEPPRRKLTDQLRKHVKSK
jgi:hypothetical protein